MPNPLDSLMSDIITRIEAGVPPWRAPWATAGGDPVLPLRSDGQPFSGTNCWLLAAAAATRGYRSPYFFTFKQALAIGAPVRAGEKSQQALLYKTRVIDGDNDNEGGAGISGERTLRYLKVYAIFNAEQLTDCPAQYLAAAPVTPQARTAIQNSVLDAIPAEIIHQGSSAFYSLTDDKIRLPPVSAFATVDDYIAIRAHECAHWSGAPTRLNREFGKKFGDDAYAFEELVAEIASALLGLHMRTPPQTLDSHAAYLANWAAVLKKRPGALLEASRHAQDAVNYLLAFSQHATEPAGLAA